MPPSLTRALRHVFQLFLTMIAKGFRFLVNTACRLPRAQKVFSFLEYASSYAQGKGWFASLEVEVSLCASLLPRGVQTFVDIGGNKGEYSEEIVSRFPGVRVFIFEPSRFNQSTLNLKFANNQNVHIYQFALSDSAGFMSLYADSPGSGGASLLNRRVGHFGISLSEVEKVEVKRFDEIWSKESGDVIDLCKIDVEGYELNVLRGFGEILSRVKVVQFEMGGTDIDSRTFFQDFWYFFSQHNFSLFRMSPSGLVRVHAYKEQEEGFAFKNYVAFNERFR
jgi:FkbM family methyltransferase